MEVVKDYDVHIDSKEHIALHSAKHQYYNVREHENGYIMLELWELAAPRTISGRTLEDMDQAIRNFKMEKVSAPIE